MIKWLIRLFKRTRLIERYESLADILDAHNALITKTIDVAQDMPPKYLCARYSAIQDAEERAVKAYWKNKANKYDVWRKGGKRTAQSAPVAAGNAQPSKESTAPQIAATPPPKALNEGTQVTGRQAVALEQPQKARQTEKTVVEIHIDK